MNARVQSAPTSALDAATLYRLLALRSEVFVVEQKCFYLDLDGRDLEPGTTQLWIERDDTVVATLRVLEDGDALRVGRVATAPEARGAGLAAALMREVLAAWPERDIVLDAQAHLGGWYERFGFTPTGPEFLEDGIPHLPMRRPARAATTGAAPT